MNKIIKKLLFLLLTTTLLSGCGVEMFNGINGNKKVVTKDRTSSEIFSKIKISNGLDLELFQGNKNKIIVEADENLHDVIFTEVENGVLKIYSEKNIWNAASKKILVTVKNLNELTATSGAFIKNDKLFSADTLTVIATSGADIEFLVSGNSLITVATSGADLEVSGNTTYHNATATSGASINAKKLEGETVIATATSSADIDVLVSENLTASATSGGDIDYFGNPQKINKKSNSGGSISKKQ